MGMIIALLTVVTGLLAGLGPTRTAGARWIVWLARKRWAALKYGVIRRYNRLHRFQHDWDLRFQARYWEPICPDPGDPRLLRTRLCDGSIIAIYWPPFHIKGKTCR